MKILGLDLGTNSIGWAVVEKEDEKMKLVEKGVHIFQEGVKIEKGIEGSKAAERTTFRSSRRMKYRRKLRKIETLKALSEFGYCPEIKFEELYDWRYKKIYPQNKQLRDWWSTNEKNNKTPYYFRNLAATKKLDLTFDNNRFAIGRAFYHIAQRRGFISNRLEGTKESEGVIKKSIAEISLEKGNRTLGQFFFEKYKKEEKIRDTYTHREEHYFKEFESICKLQQLPEELIVKLKYAIFFQRPLKSQKGLIGKCVFEPNKPRCAVSRPEFEEYRMLTFINNIKIKAPGDEKIRFLTKEEKERIKPLFYRKSKEYFDFEDLAKILAPKKQYKFFKSKDVSSMDWLFNFPMKTSISGCPVSARLIEILGEDFMNFKFEYTRPRDGKTSHIDINDIWHVLFTYNSYDKLAEFGRSRLKFTNEQIEKLLKIRLKQDYAALSLKAIRKILPYLHEGLIYSHSVFLANMEEVIPKEIWNDNMNRKIIKNEVYNIIQTQNEEKQLIEIVNGIINNNQEERTVWSKEVENIYKKDLNKRIALHFGKNRYADFTEEQRNRIEFKAFELLKKQMQKNMGKGEFVKIQRIEDRVKAFISNNFTIDESKLNKIYHPSAIDVYKPPIKGKDGKLYLGSPLVSSIRNPMAMRALHQLRKIINELIKKEMIDSNTRIHIEMSRGLMNANERKALKAWQNVNEVKRKEYIQKIKEHFGEDYQPSEDEILKYAFWEFPS